MKKILFCILVLTASLNIEAQTTLANKLRITGNTTDNTAVKVNVQANDGTVNTRPLADVIEYLEFASAVNLPVTGVSGKLYLTRDNNRLYRWNGTIYVEVTADISGKENISNKQNSLASDGTNTKYPTVTAVNTGLATKVDKVSGKSLLSDSEITRLGTLANYTHPTNHPPSIITQDASNRFVTDAEKTAWNAKQSALGYTAENSANKNVANGYAGLGSDGKLISSQLPSITISDTFVVGSQSAMLAVTAETGDVAVRTDLNKSFILKGTNSTVLADWQELLTPTSAVTTVFGRNGAVTAQSGDYNADQITETVTRVFQTPTQRTNNDATSSIQTQLNGKVNLSASETIGGVKTFSNMPILSSATNVNGQIVYADASKQLKTTTTFKYNDATGVLTTSLGNLGTNAYTSTSFQPLLINPITGTGEADYLPKFTGSGSLGNSAILEYDGNIGIGNTFPTYKLDVSGDVNVSNDLWVNGKFPLTVRANEGVNIGNGYGLYWYNDVSVPGATAGIGQTTGGLRFFTGSSLAIPKMAVNADGNVGIGTTSPITKLQTEVSSSIGAGGADGVRVSNGLMGLNYGVESTNNYSWIQSALGGTGVKSLSLNPNGGNVGIGTTTPTEKLEVNGNIKAGSATFSSTVTASNGTLIGGTLTSGYVPKATGVNNLGNSLMFENTSGMEIFKSGGSELRLSNGNNITTIKSVEVGADAEMTFNTQTNTERMRINSNGNVGIGTTAPNDRLSIKGVETTFEIGTSASDSQLLSFNRTTNSYKDITFRGKSFVFSPYDSEKARISDTGQATFSSSVTANGLNVTGTGTFTEGVELRGRTLIRSEALNGDLKIFQYNSGGSYLRDALVVSNATGQATFASSVRANGGGWENGLSVIASSLTGADLRLSNTIAGGQDWHITSAGANNVAGVGSLQFYNNTNTTNALMLSSTGQATFASSVTATNFNGSATLTGTPTAPTATAGTNTTQIATTAFVQATRPYKVYTALIKQTSTNAPIITVLENNLGGTIVWTRSETGVYLGTLTGAFPLGKTFVTCSSQYFGYTVMLRLDANTVSILTRGPSNTPVDSFLEHNAVEIRVYQ